MVEVEPGRAERCIHLESEGTSLLVGSRGKINKLEGDIFQIMQLAKEELGESTPEMYLEKESWWWNDAVRQAVYEKRMLFRE